MKASLITPVLGIFLAWPFAVNAQVNDQKMRDAITDAAPFVISNIKLRDPETARLAYIALRTYDAARVSRTDLAKPPTERVKKALDEAINQAETFSESLAFRAGWKKATDIGESTPVSAIPARNGTELIKAEEIETLCRRYCLSITYPRMSDAELVRVSMWVYQQTSSAKSPFAEVFLAQISKRHGIDVNKLKPGVASKQLARRVLSSLKEQQGLKLDEIIGDATRLKDTGSSQLVLLREATENLVQLIRKDKPQDNASPKQQRLADGFGAATAVALLVNDPKTAAVFSKAGRLANAISDLTANATQGVLQKAPLSAINPYLLAINVGLDLVQGDQKKSEMGILLEQLQQISQQIEELRAEMNKRFDALEKKIDIYFAKTFKILDGVESKQDLALQYLQSIQSSLDELHYLQKAGFESVGLLLLQPRINECISEPSLTSSNKLSKLSFANCRDAFAALSLGYLRGAVRTPDQSDVDVLRFISRKFSGRFSAAARISDLPLPDEWWLGTKYLILLAQNNSNLRADLLATSGLPHQPISLERVIDAGEKLQSFVRTMGLNEKGQLRSELISDILNEYSSNVTQLVSVINGVTEKRQTEGPRPGLTFSEQKPKDGTDYKFASNRIPLCVGSKPILKSPLRHWASDNPARDAKIVTYDPRQFPLDKSFAALLPNSVAWALATKALDADLTGCFKQYIISVSVAEDKKGNVTGIKSDLEADLELSLSYKVPGEKKPRPPFVVARLVGNTTQTSPLFDPRWGAPLAQLLWIGGGAGDYAAVPFTKTPNYMRAQEWLSSTGRDEQGLKNFESEYKKTLDAKKIEIRADTDAPLNRVRNNIDYSRKALTFGFGENATPDQALIARNTILALWQILRSELLKELDRDYPQYPDTPYKA